MFAVELLKHMLKPTMRSLSANYGNASTDKLVALTLIPTNWSDNSYQLEGTLVSSEINVAVCD